MIDPMQSASAGAARDDYTVVPLRSILQTLWRRLWVVACVMILVTGTAVGISFLRTPQYEATTKIMIGQENRFKDDYVQPASELQALTKTMAEAVADTSTANAVIRELDLPLSSRSLLENLSAEAIEETQFVTVTYRDPQPQRA